MFDPQSAESLFGHVVFGQVVDGLDVLKAIEKAGLSCRVTSNLDVIVDCG